MPPRMGRRRWSVELGRMCVVSRVASGCERSRPAWTRRSDEAGMLVRRESSVLRVDIEVEGGREKGMSGSGKVY
jgi:hypothetical protein